MRTTIDGVGRLVIPKRFRDELGFAAGTELELTVIDGHLEIAVPSSVEVQDGPHGPRFVAGGEERLDAGQVRDLMERGRR